MSGWMLGIGTEYALWDRWTAKIEYNMIDFGSDSPFSNDKFLCARINPEKGDERMI